jgi:hypothetical protein
MAIMPGAGRLVANRRFFLTAINGFLSIGVYQFLRWRSIIAESYVSEIILPGTPNR